MRAVPVLGSRWLAFREGSLVSSAPQSRKAPALGDTHPRLSGFLAYRPVKAAKGKGMSKARRFIFCPTLWRVWAGGVVQGKSALGFLLRYACRDFANPSLSLSVMGEIQSFPNPIGLRFPSSAVSSPAFRSAFSRRKGRSQEAQSPFL